MQRALLLTLSALLWSLPAAAQDAAALIEQGRLPELSAQKGAREGLAKLGPAAIGPLFGRLGAVPAADDVVAQNLALFVVQEAARPGNGAARERMAAVLLNEAAEDRPLPARRYALELLSYVAGPESVEPMARLLQDGELADMALYVLKRTPGAAAANALARGARKATGELKIALLSALPERASDRAGEIPTTLSLALESREEAVRIAARAGLARLPITAPGILNRPLTEILHPEMVAGSDREKAAAVDAYLAHADLLAVKGAKESRTAREIYRWALVKGTDSRTRVAGLMGLSRIGTTEYGAKLVAGDVVAALESPDRAVRGGAADSLARMPGLTELLTKEASGPRQPARVALLRVLGRRRDPASGPALRKAARDPDPQVAVAAVAALGELRDPSMAGELMRLAASGPGEVRPAALRAYFQAVGATQNPDVEESLYVDGLRVASTDEERRLALQGLARLGMAVSLPTIEPYLAAGPLQADAAATAAAIADRMAARGLKQDAAALYRRALEAAGGNTGLRRRIGSRLRDLGVEVDLAGESGFLTRWLALGPVPGRARWTEQDPFDPKAPLAPKQPVRVDGQNLHWKAAPVTDPDGMLDLEQALASRQDAVAYLYAEVVSPGDQEALFKIGSDDGFVLWVNGEKAGQVLADRPYVADQDTVKARLKQGVNRVLLKVTQGSGGWSAGVRLTAPNGAPLRLEQRKL